MSISGGQEKVISYWSRQLQKAEHNHYSTGKEALAAVATVKEFYHTSMVPGSC